MLELGAAAGHDDGGSAEGRDENAHCEHGQHDQAGEEQDDVETRRVGPTID
jgi:hypothetical protein